MAWDPVWEDVYKNQAWGKYPGEELIRFVARNFYKTPNRQDIKILELGCGPGPNLWFAAREGFAVYGIDGSATAVAKAKERLDLEVPNWCGQIQKGDFINLPLLDATVDAILDNEAVYCNSYDNAKLIYQEAARVLKPNGKIFVRTFAEGCWGDGLGEPLGHRAFLVNEGPLADKGYVRFTAEDEIADLLAPFDVHNVELLSKRMDNRRDYLKEWIITGEKK